MAGQGAKSLVTFVSDYGPGIDNENYISAAFEAKGGKVMRGAYATGGQVGQLAGIPGTQDNLDALGLPELSANTNLNTLAQLTPGEQSIWDMAYKARGMRGGGLPQCPTQTAITAPAAPPQRTLPAEPLAAAVRPFAAALGVFWRAASPAFSPTGPPFMSIKCTGAATWRPLLQMGCFAAK
jgi:hypothetical protein